MTPRELVKRNSTPSEVGAPRSAVFPDPPEQGFLRIAPANPVQRVMGLLRKYAWIIAICIVVSVLLSLLYAARQPRLYRATAKIAIYHETDASVPSIQNLGSVLGDSDESTVGIETQIHVVRSKTLALDVVRKLGLGRNSEFLANAKPEIAELQRVSNQSASEQAIESVVADVMLTGLSVTPVRNTRVVEVSFTGADRQLNPKIINALVDDFIEDSIRSRYEASNRAARFLSGQLTGLRAKVEQSQQQLIAYERKHDIVMVDEKQNVVTSKLDELNKQLVAAEEDRIEKEALYTTIAVGNLEHLPDMKAGEGLQSLRLREAELKNDYAQASSVYGPNHPRVVELTNRLKSIDTSIQAEIKHLQGRAQTEYQIALRREHKLRHAFEAQKGEANRLNESAIQYGLLKREFESNRQLYDGLQERMKEAGIAAGLRSSNIRVIDSAQSTLLPVSPNLPRSGYIGLFLGFLLSAVVVGIRECMNRTLRDPAEVEFFTAMSSLAIIPYHRRAKRLPASTFNDEIVCLAQPGCAISEAYRALGTSILLASKDLKTLLVTSPVSGEGKTSTAANTAVIMAQQGKRVLLVDADLRKPALHLGFGIVTQPGLSSLLLGEADVAQVIRSCERAPTLSIVPAGVPQPMPAEMLGSEKMSELIARWRTEYDYIIVDTPPILAVTDSVRLSRQADSVLLVIRAGHTTRETLARSCDLLNQAKVPVLGIVVNGVSSRTSGPYYYGYYPELTNKYYRQQRQA